jgi:hypothetical protein
VSKKSEKREKREKEKEALMCKLFGVAGIRKEHSHVTWRILEAIQPLMCKFNDDGFGYAALSGQELWGERWFDTNYAFRLRHLPIPEGYEKVLKKCNIGWSDFGVRPPGKLPEISALIAHARKCTNNQGPENVHPFVVDSTALIHNGVIHEYDKKTLDMTGSNGCDSMGLLRQYLKSNVLYDLDKLSPAFSDIGGSQICMVLGHDGERWILDIWRNDYNTLWAAKVKLGTEDVGFFFTTDLSDIASAIPAVREQHKAWGDLYIQAAFQFEAGNALRIDATTGGFVAHSPFRKETYVSRGGGVVTHFHGGGRHLSAGVSYTPPSSLPASLPTIVSETSPGGGTSAVVREAVRELGGGRYFEEESGHERSLPNFHGHSSD